MILWFGQPIDFSAILKSHRDPAPARQLHNFFRARVLPPARNYHAIDRAPRLHRFTHRVNSRQPVNQRTHASKQCIEKLKINSQFAIFSQARNKTPLSVQAQVSPPPQKATPPLHRSAKSRDPALPVPLVQPTPAESDETNPGSASPNLLSWS